MADPALQAYLAGIDPAARPLVIALDDVIRTAHPDFEVAIKYRILMYALRGDWRTWVCALDGNRNRVSLRFLYGVLLADPLHVLRAGSSVLMTWDFPLEASLDTAAVATYVTEAVTRYPEYRANTPAVLAASRAAASARRGPKSNA